jgi:excinuclease ABC subunit C
MLRAEPCRVEIGDLESLDALLANTPNMPAVFAVHAKSGTPYIARTGQLQRRLKRLLSSREKASRMLYLRELATVVEYWLCNSRLESDLTLYEVAREHLPDSYTRYIRLRYPSYVKLIQSNEFPRTVVTSRLTNAGLFYGPFRTRAAAEQFDHGMLGLFQLRRCEEDLAPHPDHPGCMYGEMNMCLRPCQQAVTIQEYASESARVAEFLSTGGKHLLSTAEAARDRLSTEMQFEEAARQHKRIEQIAAVLKQRDDLATDLDRLNGIAVTPLRAGAVTLWFFERGAWNSRLDLDVQPHAADPVPLDRRLKDTFQSLPQIETGVRERQEHIALLARWYYSSWRDGEWLAFDSRDKIPYRKLVHAVSRMANAPVNAL